MGFYVHKVLCSPEMSRFYLSSINVSLHIFTADTITVTVVSDLHVKEHGNID